MRLKRLQRLNGSEVNAIKCPTIRCGFCRAQPRIGLQSDSVVHRGSHNPSDIPMKILAPVDGSPASLRAVKLAIELAAGRRETRIILLNVQNIPMLAPTEGARAVMAILIEEEEERASAEALREAIRACEGAGVLFTVRIERGTPAAVIHQIAGEEKADHIVMGTRGLGGIRGLLGSVSTQVLHLVGEVPVTLLK